MTFRFTHLILTLGAAIICSTTVAEAAIVRLHRAVTLDKGLVRLGDVADVHADSESLATSIRAATLGPAPIPGNRTRFTLNQVRSRLNSRRIELGMIEFQGSSSVTVTRRKHLTRTSQSSGARLATQDESRPKNGKAIIRTQSASESKPTVRTVAAIREVSTADMRLAESIVHDLVRDYLERWAPEWGNPFIRPLLSTDVVPMILSARGGNLKIVEGKVLNEDHFLLTLAVPPPKTTAESSKVGPTTVADDPGQVRVRVRVARRPKVLAARHSISPGQLIRATDLEWIEVDDERNGTSDPDELIGMEARRFFRAGDAIRVESVRPVKLVERGQLVKVTSVVGSVRVTGTYQARKAGVKNEMIELRSLDGERSILARVTGMSQAELLSDGVAPASSDTGIRLSYAGN